jgi:hypothetical protein
MPREKSEFEKKMDTWGERSETFMIQVASNMGLMLLITGHLIWKYKWRVLLGIIAYILIVQTTQDLFF